MNESQLRNYLRKHLLSEFPDLSYHDGLLYRRPPSPLVRGFYFGRATHDTNSFNVQAFVQPTYIPSDILWFNMGKRLGTISGGAGKWWTVTEEGDAERVFQEVKQYMRKEGVPYLDARDDLHGLISVYGPLAKDPKVDLIEAVAGALALHGDYKAALRLTEELITSSRKHMAKSPWLKDVLARAMELRDTLRTEPESAPRILQERSSFTLAHLGLGG